MTEKPFSKPGVIKSGATLAKEYFLESNERYSALLLLSGVILGIVTLVALTAIFAWWNVGFWTALTEMSMPLYIESMKIFAVLTACYVGVSVAKNYLLDVLTIRWRNWLTEHLINKFTARNANNYLNLGRHAAQIENPEQRIQQDVLSFVDQTLSLTMNLLESILTQAAFTGTLWVVGGALTFVLLGTSITIPGYLVWVAILFAAVSSVITHTIGRALAALTNNQKGLEADFRKDMELLSNDAESVAQDHGEVYYKQSLTNKLQSICKNSYESIKIRTRLTAFNSFYQQISGIFPYIAAAPLYFAKKTSIGQLMEIGFSFTQVQFSLSWFTNSYERIASYKTSVTRIVELKNAMQDDGLTTTPKCIVVHEDNISEKPHELKVRNLNIAYPSSTNYMMRELNLTFKPGENTLIKGRSGLGKSTLFKVMAGTWKYGTGEVSVSNHHKMCFLPQKPSLPNDTLKAVLAYPEPVDTYTDIQYETVLRAVGHMDKFIDELNTKAIWSKRLSGGEQQRISFARALLKKPDWLFLDEATASLDEKSESTMYTLIKEQLKSTTFVSIAHRPTVERYHNRVVTFDADKEGIICLNDEHRLIEQYTAAANDEDSMLVTNALTPTIKS